MQLNIYYVAILSIALSGVFNWIILYITKKYSFKKSSLLNEKRLVNKNTPPLGGVASAAAFFISVNFLGDADYNFIIIGAFSLLISILGSIDDFFNLSWKIKLFFQSIFVAIPIIYLNIFLNIESLLNLDLNNSFNFLISVLWVILIINSINFIDNMDGLAVVVTGSICYQSIVLTYSLNQNKLTDISVVLLFVILGFFIYNFPPAKLYLGDSGSLFIGFCLGFLSILFTWNTNQSYLLSYTLSPVLLFFTIPLLDFLVIMWHRISNGLSPTEGGTDHVSHRLLAKGLTEKQVLFLFFIYSAFNFLLILGYVFLNSLLSLFALVIYLLQFLLLFNYLRKLKILS
ncbi:MAG: hypothetical protein CL493_00630 [Actinobacteria bacterium]|nr:hypothetical protein [Actinomycetota bacterium]|tara:strand:+ start:1409 stop:2440 length:1032 start_codon:yes stop_codon:yes gene_type:complete